MRCCAITYHPWLGNGLDLCSERQNVGLRDRDSHHIQKGSAEAILTLNSFPGKSVLRPARAPTQLIYVVPPLGL